MEKKVYRETPLKLALIVCSCVGVLLLLMLIPGWSSIKEKEKTNHLIAFSLPFIIMALTMLICWLAIKKRAIRVDLNGAEIIARRPLGKAERKHFLWRDVSSVNLTSETTTARGSTLTTYTLSVTVVGGGCGREIILMNKSWLDEKLKDLLTDVNEATKAHLGTIWEECRENETRPVIGTLPPFCLIALDPARAANKVLNPPTSNPATVVAQTAAMEKTSKIKTANWRLWLALASPFLIILPLFVMLFAKVHYTYYFGYLFGAAAVVGVLTYLSARRARAESAKAKIETVKTF